MKYLFMIFLLSGCGAEVHGHLDTVKVDPIQVQISTVINYQAAEQYCGNQCGGNQSCTKSCYYQFLAVLGAASSLPVNTPTPSPTP